MKKLLRVLASKSGFSLIEILAAIVILGLIVGPFLSMFIQSAKTTHVTETMNDATDVANAQMEDMYHIVTHSTSDKIDEQMSEQDFTKINDGYSKKVNDYTVMVQLRPVPDQPSLVDVIVQIYKENDREAQLESIYEWEN
ncbi:prepilin-type N-terminal cleavage/methylation domain-containing protein [Pullulanibacillus pueri]|uniref:Prepilin-type N-terminal cleavage/methylation domain-containing protein n=1 Tax=Pullulanibacillus pueri TaxID=1437324 RepID=A0A8J2ZYI0_9BACL|nr:type II secretion system protein [Pullulanibacillus pueri]MBM7680511.1 prepilin-type N-terminal cleavage/methylation domain-containing protein [Pullulanibacillus pueri]GGH86073.1 hypothetical protein GCM10007096_32930 [Pullulanibacillus pueri]